MAVLLKQFEFTLVPNQKITMTTGATIHTANGLYMNVKKRGGETVAQPRQPAAAVA